MPKTRSLRLACAITTLAGVAPAAADRDPPSTTSGGDATRAWGAAAVADLRGTAPGARVVWRDGATAPRHLSGFASRWFTGDALDVARAFVAENPALLGLTRASRIVPLRVSRATGGAAVVRMQQRVGGLPVHGAEVVLRVEDGRVTLVNNGTRPDAMAGRIEVRVDAASARGRVQAMVPDAAVDEPALVLVERGLAGLAATWLVDARQPAPLGAWTFHVDARSGRIVRRDDRLRAARARVAAASSGRLAVTEVELAGLTSTTELTGARAATMKQVVDDDFEISTTRNATPDAAGDYLYDPAEPGLDDGFAEVNAYHHIDRAARYAEALGHPRAGAPPVLGIVNYEEPGGPLSGAFAGETLEGQPALYFGQTDVDWAYDADVVAHEFFHVVVGETAGLLFGEVDELGGWNDPLALDEAFSDYFSSSLAGDPVVGDYVAGSEETPPEATVPRRLDDDHACPESLVGEPHEDGTIWSAAGWDIRTELGAELADQIVFATLLELPPLARFPEAAQTAIDQAERLGGVAAADAVQRIMEARGLIDCERIVPLRPGADEERFGVTFPGMPGFVQYRLEVPADADHVELSLRGYGVDERNARVEGGLGHRLLLRKGEPVRVTPAADATYTYEADLVGPIDAGVTLGAGGDASLEPGATYFILVAAELGDGTASAGLYYVGAVAAEASPASDDGGCGCRIGEPVASAANAAVLLLVLFSVFRRSARPCAGRIPAGRRHARQAGAPVARHAGMMTARVLPTLLFVALAAACGGKSDAGDPDGGGPDVGDPDAGDVSFAGTVISASSASVIESEPHLAASADGATLVAVWTARTGPDWLDEGVIGYAFSGDAGATWSSPATIGFPGRDRQVNVRVTADPDGGFWMAWLGRSFGEAPDAIVVARAAAGEAVFGEPFEVTDPALAGTVAYDLPSVVAHAGGAVAAYRQTEDSDVGQCDEIAIARTEDGERWERVVVSPCEPADWIKNMTALCADPAGERVWLAHVVGDETGLRLEARASTDGGVSWPEAGRSVVSADGEPVAFDPIFCVAEGDEMWVAYGLSDDPLVPGVFGKLRSIRVAHLDGGGVVDVAEAFDPDDGFAMHPQILRDDAGTNHVFYLAGAEDGDVSGSLRTTRLVGDGPATASEQVDGPLRFEQTWGVPGFLGDYFGVAATADGVGVAYSVHAGDDVHVAFQRR